MFEMIVYLTFSILFGIIACFWGKKFYFPILMSGIFLLSITSYLGTFGFTWQNIVLGSLCSFILALFTRCLYKADLFLLGACGGIVLGMFISNIPPEATGISKLSILVVCAIILGICAVKWCDLFIVIATSLQGAATIAKSVCFLSINFLHLQDFIYADGIISTIMHLEAYLENNLIQKNPTLLISLMLFFTVAGCWFQVSQTKKLRTSLS